MNRNEVPTEIALAFSQIIMNFMISVAITGVLTILFVIFSDLPLIGFVIGLFGTQLIILYFENKKDLKTIWFWYQNNKDHEIHGFPESTYSSEREKADNAFLNTMHGRKFHVTEPDNPKNLKESASKSLLDD